MNCNVTEVKDAKLVAINEKYGNEIMLRVAQKGDPDYAEENGFLSEAERNHRVKNIAMRVVKACMVLGESTIVDIASPDFKQHELANAIRAVKTSVIGNQAQTAQAAVLMSGANAVALKENAIKEQVIALNFDDLVRDSLKYLRKVGLEVNKVEELIDRLHENEEEDKEHMYDQASWAESRKDSLSYTTKLYLATLTDNENKDDLNQPIAVKLPKLLGVLYKNMAGSNSISDMLETLDILSEKMPIFKTIATNLRTVDAKVKNPTYNNRGEIATNFMNGFYASLCNQEAQFITTLVAKTAAGKGKKAGKTSSIVDTNKRSADKLTYAYWVEQEKNLAKTYSATEKVEKMDEAKAGWAQFLQEVANINPITNKSDGNLLLDESNFEVLGMLANGIKDLVGLDINPETFEAWRNQFITDENPKGFVKALKEMVPRLIKSHYTVGIFNDTSDAEQTSNLKNLAKLQATYDSTIALGAFMNGEGNLIHPITTHCAASKTLSLLSKDEEYFEQFSQDAMYLGNEIIKQLGENKEVAYKILDTFFDNTKGTEGVPFNKLDTFTALANRFSMFLNVKKGKISKDNRGYFLVPTPGDKGNSAVLHLEKLDNTVYTLDAVADVKKVNLESTFGKWVIQKAENEIKRINTVREEYKTLDPSLLIESYHKNTNRKDGTTSVGNGGYFNFLPALNGLLENEIPTTLLDGEGNLASKELEELVSKEAYKLIENDLEFLVKEDIAKKSSDGNTYTLTNKAVDTAGLSEVKAGLASEVDKKFPFKDALVEFVANSIVMSHDMTSVFNTDLAHFKSGKYSATSDVSQFDLAGQYSGANKRAGLAYTPGTELRISSDEHPGGAKPTANIAIVEDTYIKSPYQAVYEALLGKEKAKGYGNVNISDAQGFMSLDRYQDILVGTGAFTPKVSKVFDRIRNNEILSYEDLGTVLQPQKGFYFGQTKSEVFNRIMPFNMKYSLIPIIPQMIYKTVNGKITNEVLNPTLHNFYHQMEQKGIDEIVMPTSVKVGGYNINKTDSQDMKYVTIDNRFWRMPLVVPYHHGNEENFGSQIRKLITNNLSADASFNVAGKQMSSKELKDHYQKTIGDMIEKRAERLIDRLSSNGQLDRGKIANMIIKEIKNNAYKTTPEFIVKALEVVEDEFGNTDTRIPLSYPTLKVKVESSITSLFKKDVMKTKINGHSAVQVTSLGYVEEDAIGTDRQLKFMRLGKRVNGELVELEEAEAVRVAKILGNPKSSEYKETINAFEVMPADILVSPQYFLESMHKMTKNIGEKELAALNKLKDEAISMKAKGFAIDKDTVKAGQKAQEAYNKAIAKKKAFYASITTPAGELDLDKIRQKGLDTLVTYRIPTQDLSSMFPARIKGFLPSALGSTVVIPGEITEQSGSDYDIDKVYLEYQGIRGDIENGIFKDYTESNNIVDVHYSVLTHASTFAGLMTPNGSNELKKNRIEETSEQSTDWGSMRTQEPFRANNVAGKEMIAITSIANTLCSLSKDIKMELKDSIIVDGEAYRSFSNERGTDGSLISTAIAERQTAAVDNANDPILGDLNFNSFTAGVELCLTHLGVPTAYTTALFQQPIMKELTKQYMTEMTTGNGFPLKEAVKITCKKFEIPNIDVDAVKKKKVKSDVRMGVLTSNRENPTLSANNAILTRFLELYTLGQEYSRQTTSMNFDKGTKTSFIENILVQDKLASVEGTSNNAVAVTRGTETPIRNQASEISKTTMYSGGAKGADTSWEEIGKEFGLKNTKQIYVEGSKTPSGNLAISQELANKADSVIAIANETLKRSFPTSNEYVNNLIRRNYYQVKDADAVYAITNLENGLPAGGTGWAVQMGIDLGKPVYVFDENADSWFTYEGGKFKPTSTPKLTNKFAGIGSREIGEKGEAAIRDVFENQYVEKGPKKTSHIKNSVEGAQITMDADAYAAHSMSAYEKFGINKAVEVMSELLMDNTSMFHQVDYLLRETLKYRDREQLDRNTKKLLTKDFYTYLLSRNIDGMKNPIVEAVGTREAQTSILESNTSLGKAILDLKEADKEELKAQEALSGTTTAYTRTKFGLNPALDFLNVNIQTEGGIDMVRGNNTILNALDDMEVSEIAVGMKQVSEKLPDFGRKPEDLFYFDFMMNGLNTSADSFTNFIPVELVEKTGIVDYFRDLDKVVRKSDVSSGTFVNDFIERHFENLKKVKLIKGIEGATDIFEYLRTSATDGYYKYSDKQSKKFKVDLFRVTTDIDTKEKIVSKVATSGKLNKSINSYLPNIEDFNERVYAEQKALEESNKTTSTNGKC